MRSLRRTPIRALALLAVALFCTTAAARATPIGGLLISEVLFEPSGADDGREWIEIFNNTGAAIDLSGYSLGWGQNSYTANTATLPAFVLGAGQSFLIGGPISNGSNGNPVYDQVLNFNSNLGDGASNTWADVVGLFFGDVGATPGLLPVHLLVYGRNSAGTTVLDEQGNLAPVNVRTNGFAQGDSVAWDGASWQVLSTPSPGSSNIPEPDTAILVSAGLAMLAAAGRRRRAVGLTGPKASR